VEPTVTDGDTRRWWPAVRRVDVVGLVVLVLLIAWVWWASEQQGADAGPLLWLLAGIGLVAILARWATFFHATIPPALLALGIAIYAITTGDDLPHRLGPGGGSVEAAGALFATATGAAAMVTLRLAPFWPRLAFGLLTVSLFSLTLVTGSLIATVVAGVVLLATVAFLGMGMKEPRWVVVWPALSPCCSCSAASATRCWSPSVTRVSCGRRRTSTNGGAPPSTSRATRRSTASDAARSVGRRSTTPATRRAGPATNPSSSPPRPA
jgi:hypothetical protein